MPQRKPAAANGRLRILLLSREYPPETGGGGIGSYVESIAPALVARGHDVHVLSCVPGQPHSDVEREGVCIHRRGVRRLLPKLRNRIPAAAFRLEGAVAAYAAARRLTLEFDVVEAPDWMAEGLAFALLGSHPLVAHLHTPVHLVAQHNPGSFRWSRTAQLADRFERVAVRRAHVVTSPSRLLADDLVRSGWLGANEPCIIRYAIDRRMWDALPSPASSPPRVLTVGRLEARKAPEVLVRAAALLAPDVPGLEVVFAGSPGVRGSGSYREWLTALAADLDAPCRFVDPLPRAELPQLVASTRAVAVISRYDNFPFTALEAMAAARPVVCTRTTGTAEILAGTRGGRVVPPDDPAALATALRPYLMEAATAEEAGREARTIVARECSPERVAAVREACYFKAIRRWRAPNARREPGQPAGQAPPFVQK